MSERIQPILDYRTLLIFSLLQHGVDPELIIDKPEEDLRDMLRDVRNSEDAFDILALKGDH